MAGLTALDVEPLSTPNPFFNPRRATSVQNWALQKLPFLRSMRRRACSQRGTRLSIAALLLAMVSN